MFAPTDYQRRMASLHRAEVLRCGSVPASFAKVAMARRLRQQRAETPGAVDPVAASRADGSPFLLRG